MFDIKKNKHKMPEIDFELKLDSYHSNAANCLHCKRGVLDDFLLKDGKSKVVK